ncbi:MAG TPA: UDP-3-O-(3-hydroxymyristoyl)glucosamine N-acyltransferase [Nitrospiria bacterium]|nr:UDP-3-O-(3-hydroxymyristoyl)glucosamine N-acyltransferase [Nitrospiria bacterium]
MKTARLKEIADLVQGKIVGDPTITITGVNSIREAQRGEITFLANPRYRADLEKSTASAVVVAKSLDGFSIPMIVVENPYYAFAQIVKFFYTLSYHPLGVSEQAIVGAGVVMGKDVSIHPLAVIGAGAHIGDRVTIYPGCYIGAETEIGDESLIYPNVTIRERIKIGKRVIIHSGTVIGSDGFGFSTHQGRHEKILQIGTVVVEDDVEIGSNVSVDRAALGKTVIKRGTKIDNLVQIAHNVVIGEDCLIVAQVGISGSTEIGHHVILAGQVGLVGHIKLGDHVIVGAKSGVSNDLASRSVVSGIPVIEHKTWLKTQAILPHLPEFRKRIIALEDRIKQLETLLQQDKHEGKEDD